MLSHIWTVKNKNKAPFVSVPADFGGSAVPALVVSLGAFPTLLFFRMLLAAEPKPFADAQPSPHTLSSSAAPSTVAGCVSVWTSGCSPGPHSCAAGSQLRFADAEPPAPDAHTAAAVLHLLENKIESKQIEIYVCKWNWYEWVRCLESKKSNLWSPHAKFKHVHERYLVLQKWWGRWCFLRT